MFYAQGVREGDDAYKVTAERLLQAYEDEALAQKLTYRDHYNIACSRSIMGNMDKALEHLRNALERGGTLVNWAQKDPLLKNVRDHNKADFDKLCGITPSRRMTFDLPTWRTFPKPIPFAPDASVTVIAVVTQQAGTASYTSHRYDDAIVHAIEVQAIRISLPLGTGDGPAVKFAAHMADPEATYHLVAK